MKRYMEKNPYTVVSAVFLIVITCGLVWLGWGAFILAYFAVLYCIVIIGIRLDDISRQIRDLGALQTTLLKESGNPGTFTQAVVEIHQLNGQLNEIKALLAQFQKSMERTSQTPDP